MSFEVYNALKSADVAAMKQQHADMQKVLREYVANSQREIAAMELAIRAAEVMQGSDPASTGLVGSLVKMMSTSFVEVPYDPMQQVAITTTEAARVEPVAEVAAEIPIELQATESVVDQVAKTDPPQASVVECLPQQSSGVLTLQQRAELYLQHNGESTTMALMQYLDLPNALATERLLKDYSGIVRKGTKWALAQV